VPRRGVLLLFLDGVGIGGDDPHVNPFLTARLPVLRSLLGGAVPTLRTPVLEHGAARTAPLDATLGVEGVPQSGTGQAALLTGTNAPREYGRHFGPWTPSALRPLVERANLLASVQNQGRTAAFANAYPAAWPQRRAARRAAAAPLAAHSAGTMVRHEDALRAGEAVASEIVNDRWIEHLDAGLPRVTEEAAGANLARIAATAQLTLFAHYDTDTAGHTQSPVRARSALERVDRFLGGLLEHLDGDTTLVIASDHGNVEDVGAGHTLNPALGLAVGPGAGAILGDARDLTRVAPAILAHLAGAV